MSRFVDDAETSEHLKCRAVSLETQGAFIERGVSEAPRVQRRPG